MSISSVTLLHNVELIKYPWRQCLKSALEFVDDAIVVLAGPHDDDTVNQVIRFAAEHEHVSIVYSFADAHQVLEHGNGAYITRMIFDNRVRWPDNHIGLSNLTNIGIEYAHTDWVFQLQADEIVDEKSYPEFAIVQKLPPEIKGASFAFRHYCGDFHHVFPFIYRRMVRACRVDSHISAVGDAAMWAGTNDEQMYEANVLIHHCGKVHVGREMEAAVKEYRFQTELYSRQFDVDPRVKTAYDAGGINYFQIGEDVEPFDGPWPKYVREYALELGAVLGDPKKLR